MGLYESGMGLHGTTWNRMGTVQGIAAYVFLNCVSLCWQHCDIFASLILTLKSFFVVISLKTRVRRFSDIKRVFVRQIKQVRIVDSQKHKKFYIGDPSENTLLLTSFASWLV